MKASFTNMRFFALASFLLLPMLIFGQGGAALSKLNAMLSPDHVIALKGRQLTVVGFRDGKKVKTDKVNMLDLDPASVALDTALSIVSVSCFPEMGECVQRHLHADGQKSYRWRIAFDIENRAKTEELMTAIRQMLQEIQKQ